MISDSSKSTGKMPVLFVGHGNPMNAIADNDFTKGIRRISESFEKPRAILCISAHWETRGTFITASEFPQTRHDFGGFSKELFEVQYPVYGSPVLAGEVKRMVQRTNVEFDYSWGLDHGAWSVLRHMYPDADVPVVQLSLDYGKAPSWHYELARELKALRGKGVLIIGSGNMVHNLKRICWEKLDADEFGFDWAYEANNKMKEFILSRDYTSLINYSLQGNAFRLAVPTPEHYLPLLYVLGLSSNQEEIEIFNDKAVAGSLTMTSVKFG